MCKNFSLMSVFMMGFFVLVAGTSGLHAGETTQICIKDTAEESMHFNVHFKDGGKTKKLDSEPFDTGEKCLDVPADSTNVELDVYKKNFIIWDKVCTKSWAEAPPETVRGELANTAEGIGCVGI